MALDGTYAGLQASVASWLNRTDLTAIIPDFVTIAESKIARDLKLRKQIKSGTLTTVTNTRNLALPADWIEFENLNVDGSADTPLTYVTTAHLDEKYPENGFSGKPAVYSIEGDYVQFGPMPDIVYTINITYYARFAALSSGANWLFTNHPNNQFARLLNHFFRLAIPVF